VVTEQSIKRVLTELNCSAEQFCRIAGISQTRWSQAMRGIKPLGGAEAVALLNLVMELRQIQRDMAPFEISFRNPRLIQVLISKRRDGLRVVALPVGTLQAIADWEAEIEPVANDAGSRSETA
jgi:transcriptional regulator with XRE-family HTH domain